MTHYIAERCVEQTAATSNSLQFGKVGGAETCDLNMRPVHVSGG